MRTVLAQPSVRTSLPQLSTVTPTEASSLGTHPHLCLQRPRPHPPKQAHNPVHESPGRGWGGWAAAQERSAHASQRGSPHPGQPHKAPEGSLGLTSGAEPAAEVAVLRLVLGHVTRGHAERQVHLQSERGDRRHQEGPSVDGAHASSAQTHACREAHGHLLGVGFAGAHELGPSLGSVNSVFAHLPLGDVPRNPQTATHSTSSDTHTPVPDRADVTPLSLGESVCRLPSPSASHRLCCVLPQAELLKTPPRQALPF